MTTTRVLGRAIKNICGLMIALSILTGCATLFTDNNRQMEFKSNPPGADVIYNGLRIGKTPMTWTLSGTDIYSTDTVTFYKKGYERLTRPVQKSFQLVSLCNLGCLIAWAIDGFTGNVMRIDSKVIEVKLDKIEGTKSGQDEARRRPSSCEIKDISRPV